MVSEWHSDVAQEVRHRRSDAEQLPEDDQQRYPNSRVRQSQERAQVECNHAAADASVAVQCSAHRTDFRMPSPTRSSRSHCARNGCTSAAGRAACGRCHIWSGAHVGDRVGLAVQQHRNRPPQAHLAPLRRRRSNLEKAPTWGDILFMTEDNRQVVERLRMEAGEA